MKFSSHALLLVVSTSAFATSSLAFFVPVHQPQARSSRTRNNNSLRSSLLSSSKLFASTDARSEVEALRAAAAKAREEADRLSEELGKSPSAVAKQGAVPTLPQKSKQEVQSLVPAILAESDVAKQAAQWQELKDSQSVTAFASANLKTFPVSLSMLEQRAGLSAETLGLSENEVSLDDFKYATLYVAGGSGVAAILSLALLPPNIGATLCYLFALLPIVFLGIGSTAPGLIANAIAGLRGDGDSDEKVSPAERRCRHEAAHFCCGYWCGLPVREYSVGGGDGGDGGGVAQVEFGVASSNNYSNTEVAALAVTALAGLVGEAKMWGGAKGASEDLMALEAVFRRSGEFIGAAAQQDLTRWGALTAALLLKQNEAKYEQVVEAFQRQASIEDCITILES